MSEAPRLRGAQLGDVAPHLFLSHSSKDGQIATSLARNLNTCGVDVWLDAWELRVGADLQERISDAIAKSRFVGIVVGKHFDDSKWVKGEVHQALSREMEEDRDLVLPLLVERVPTPPVLKSKKFLDFTEKSYFVSLVRLAAMVHDLGTDAIEDGIVDVQPKDVNGCIEVLRYAGFEPFCVVDMRIQKEIEKAGGEAAGTRVFFDPHEIIARPDISPSLRRLMERLIDEWRA